jgi:membrane protein implicated in regulation of membrane protease activity
MTMGASDPRRVLSWETLIMTGQRHFFINQPAGQFSTGSWLSYLILLPFMIGAVVVGFFFFAAFLALFTLAVLAVAARFWWLRRKLRRHTESGSSATRTPGRSGVLEGEYVVVTQREEVRKQ